MSKELDDSGESQGSRIELGNEASDELDLSVYGEQDIFSSEENQSETENNLNQSEHYEENNDITDNADLNLVAGERGDVSAGKNKSKINKNSIAIGMVVVLGVIIGAPIVSSMMESSSGSETTGAVFVAEEPVNVQSPHNQSAQPSSFGVAQSATFEFEGIKDEISVVKENSDKAFNLISQNLKSKDKIIEDLIQKYADLEVTLNNLSDVGSNQLVGQGQKIAQLERTINNLQTRMQAQEAANKKYENKRKQEKAELASRALRAKYEVVTVISGKARIRNTNDGSEMNIVNGDEIVGFGRIKNIAITGCITFDNNETYEPIGATCRNI
jgi:hypothetical protein